MAESCSDPSQFSLARPEAANKSENGEDVSSGSEGYETPDENLETKDSLTPVPRSQSKPTPSSSDISGDSEGYESESPGGGLAVTLSSKPSLRELRELPVTNWYLLGLQLKVRQQELERIQLKYGRDLKLCRTKMFGVWRREGDNLSYETLLRGLVAIGRQDVAESICDKKGFTIGVTTLSSSRTHSDTPIECSAALKSQDQISLPDDSSDDRLGVSDVPLLMTILGEYSSKWRVIGTALGFTVPEQDNIEGKLTLLPTAPHSHFQELLNEWVHWPTGAHTIIPTIEALETALKTLLVGLGAVPEKLRSQLLQKRLNFASKSSLHHQAETAKLPECVEKCAEFLKSWYIHATPLMPTGEWPPNLGRRYSDLTMVEMARDSLPDQDSVEQRSKAMAKGQVKQAAENEKVVRSLDDVLNQDSSKPLKVLMEGVPGVGKSTLVRKSCKDWADGKALEQFQLVFLLSLRNKKFRQANSVEELLEMYDPALRGEMVTHLQRTYGERVLFILDSFDELTEEEQSFYLEFLQGAPLHKCSIVVTSRSFAVEGFKHEEWIHRHVEILGFTERQIENYYLQNITDKSKAKAFACSLREKISLTSVSYTPLNCSILLHIFQQGRFKMPTTITELFETFVYSLLNRHSKKTKSVFGKLFHKSLHGLPKSLKSKFSTLCKLAYVGLIKDKLMFSLQDISEAFQGSYKDGMEANLLGLLFSTTSFSKESHYQFLHLTIQEYLAARWIKDQPEGEQKRFLSTNWISPRMRTTLAFNAGITQLRGVVFDDFFTQMSSSAFLDSILGHNPFVLPPGTASGPVQYKFPEPPWGDQPPTFLTAPASDPLRFLRGSVYQKPAPVSVGTQAFLNIVSMLAETSNTSLYDHRLFQRKVIQGIQLGCYRMTAVDCSAVAKFLSRCPYLLESLHFNFCNITGKSLEIFHKVSNDCCCLKYCNEVEFNYCAPSVSSGLSLIPQIPWFKNTKVLRLHGLRYPEGLCPEAFQLCSVLKLNTLTDLTISVQHIPKNHLTDYESVFLRFVEALPTNKTLECLTYNQSPAAATCESFLQLMSALSHTGIITLTLGHSKVITVDSVTIPQCRDICFKVCSKSLSSVLKLAHLRGTKGLRVQQQTIFSPCCCCKDSFKELKNSTISNQYDRPAAFSEEEESRDPGPPAGCECAIVEDSTRLIGTWLSENKTVRSLDISGCNATDKVAQHLSEGLSTNKTLTELKMDSPYLTREGAFSILNSLNQNKVLRNLYLLGVEMSISYNPYCLKVNFNSVTHGSAIVDVLQAMLQVSDVEELVMQSIKMQASNEYELLGQAIGRILTDNQALSRLVLRYFDPDISLKVSALIATGLATNHSLKILDLSVNNITSVGAVDIFKSLENNSGLEELDLSFNNQLAQASATNENESLGYVLERMLTVNQTLRRLSLSCCSLNDNVAAHIATGLAKNNSLKVLELSLNDITSAAAVHIFESLENNTSLEELDLSSNYQLGQDTTNSQDGSLGCVLEQMLTVNQTLRRLDLGWCELDDVATAQTTETAGDKHNCLCML